MPQQLTDGDYIFGTEDEELRRLGIQHTVWRPRATTAWRRAGFTAGHHIIDVGSGPGYATFDLLDIVGRNGKVTALERSPRFIAYLKSRLEQQNVQNVDIVDVDLDDPKLNVAMAQGAWCRWVIGFLSRPREFIASLRGVLEPGARIVIHEYFHYSTCRMIPRDADFEDFIEAVKTSWRATSGEPDIALDLLRWLPAEGFTITDTTPIIDVVTPGDFIWQWPSTFFDIGAERLVELGHITSEKAARVKAAVRRTAADPHGRMITPGVLEIIATAS
jgi:SAM-dependent methyltransferase